MQNSNIQALFLTLALSVLPAIESQGTINYSEESAKYLAQLIAADRGVPVDDCLDEGWGLAEGLSYLSASEQAYVFGISLEEVMAMPSGTALARPERLVWGQKIAESTAPNSPSALIPAPAPTMIPLADTSSGSGSSGGSSGSGSGGSSGDGSGDSGGGSGPVVIPVIPASPLESPFISLSAPVFNPVTSPTVNVKISHPNDPGISMVEYAIDGGSWAVYSGTVTLAGLDYPSGASLIARVSPAPTYEAFFQRSTNASAKIDSLTQLLTPTITFAENGSATEVTIVDPNATGTSQLQYQLIPIPGSAGSATTMGAYSGVFKVPTILFPDGFGIQAFAEASGPGVLDSSTKTEYYSTAPGLTAGHLDIDTNTSIAAVGTGESEAHVHDITGKYDLTAIDMFNLPADGKTKLISLPEVLKKLPEKDKTKFKILVGNGELSPGLTINIHQDGGDDISLPMDQYDDIANGDLRVYSLKGEAGSVKITGLTVTMNKDVLTGAGVIPSDTSSVKANVPGKNGEWRNGALTIQAVAVNPDNSDAFSSDTSLSAGGVQGTATSGLIWESTLFWHWDGSSYDQADNTYVPGDFSSIADTVAKFATEKKKK